MNTKNATSLISFLFLILMIGVVPAIGQVHDICSTPLPIGNPYPNPTATAYFQLGPTCVSTDMIISITISTPCPSDCEDGNSTFVIRDSQNQIVKQESFDCREGGGWTVCLPSDTYSIEVTWGCTVGNFQLQVSAPVGC